MYITRPGQMNTVGNRNMAFSSTLNPIRKLNRHERRKAAAIAREEAERTANRPAT